MRKLKRESMLISIERAASWEDVFRMLMSKIKGVPLEDFLEMNLTANNLTMVRVEKSE